MHQFIYEDEYRGQPRKLLILKPVEGTDYRVFEDANFMGSIRPVAEGGSIVRWKTEYNVLKPIAKKIGEYVESCLAQMVEED